MKYYDVSLIHVLEAYLDDESFQARDKNSLDDACARKQLDFVNEKMMDTIESKSEGK